MKKKVFSIALVIALIAIMVGGSLAYFTAEDKVENTFTIGSVNIEIWENGEVADDEEEMGQLLPIVNTDDPSADENYRDKVVQVKNTGNNPAYIRTHIAVPTALVGYLNLDVKTENWTFQYSGTAQVDGVAYTVYTYDYDYELAAGETTDKLLNGVYLYSYVDLKDNPATTETEDLEFCIRNDDGTYTYSGFAAYTGSGVAIQGINVLVASQAIQSEGFEDGATAALNAGFGENTNPWQ